jgi:tRNA-dihydrouridine synthase B
MVGISHFPLRQVLRTYLPSDAYTLWPTEMLNSRRIPDEKLGETPETLRTPDERGLVPQILGNEESFIQKSVEALEAWGAEGIDINMGCPVQKALRHNYGVALMGDPDYAAEVVRMTVRSTKLPVSVKLRAGEQGNFEFLKNFAQGLENAGAQWLCLHPRTPEQKRRGFADWSQIKRLRSEISIPLVGNGDIQTSADVFRMIDETDCDLVMAGRALAARPWMLWQVGRACGFQDPINHQARELPLTPEQEGAEYGLCLRHLVSECEKVFSPPLAMRKISFYVRTTAVWLDFGHELFSITTKAKTLEELKEAHAAFFAREQRMTGYTQLRE